MSSHITSAAIGGKGNFAGVGTIIASHRNTILSVSLSLSMITILPASLIRKNPIEYIGRQTHVLLQAKEPVVSRPILLLRLPKPIKITWLHWLAKPNNQITRLPRNRNVMRKLIRYRKRHLNVLIATVRNKEKARENHVFVCPCWKKRPRVWALIYSLSQYKRNGGHSAQNSPKEEWSGLPLVNGVTWRGCQSDHHRQPAKDDIHLFSFALRESFFLIIFFFFEVYFFYFFF